MESIDADAVIRVGVGPCMIDGSIVDGENLKGILTSQDTPVDHEFQVAEVAHTETPLTTQ